MILAQLSFFSIIYPRFSFEFIQYSCLRYVDNVQMYYKREYQGCWWSGYFLSIVVEDNCDYQ
jgi:hypothetical protein